MQATGPAHEGQAEATTTAPGTSLGWRIWALSPRLTGRSQGGQVAAAVPAPATGFGWRCGASCSRISAKGRALEGQAAENGLSSRNWRWLAHKGLKTHAARS